jgi:translation initiation factor IF-3
MIGIVPTSEGLKMAQEAGLDLVEVAPNAKPPVCKVLDFGKWKYQQQKKQDKAHAHSKGGQLKEVKIKTVRIGDHDLMIKVNHAKEFLEEGNKVQFTLQFRGREIAHSELGYEIFTKIREQLLSVGKVEMPAKLQGKRITMVMMPFHGDATKSAPAKPAGAGPARPAVSGSSLNIPVPGNSAPAAPKPAPASPANASPSNASPPPAAARPPVNPAKK